MMRLSVPVRHRDRVLARCHTVEDVRRAARRRLPRAVFDYVDGGADAEESLTANLAAFRRRRFHPTALADVSEPDVGSTLFGAPVAAPIGLAPAGYTRLIDTEGEAAVARVAARAGLPYTLSTMATISLSGVRRAAADADLWFQLYLLKDRGLARSLLDRAHAAGCRVLELAVDTAVSGRRLRDVRSGFTVPPSLRPGTVAGIAAHPSYWIRQLRSPGLRFANLDGSGNGGSIEDLGELFDPSLTWDDVESLRETWAGSLLLKGPLSPDDARRAKAIGVDGVHLSNHGGRQLDRTVAPLDLVRPVREAVGDDFTVLVDSGVRHGADVAIAVATGADAAFVGRPYLWGLAAAGGPGVAHVLDLLVAQFRRTLQLLGVATVAELRRKGDEVVRPAAWPFGSGTDIPGVAP